MKKPTAILAAIALCLAFAPGCMTPTIPPGLNVYVYVTGSGTITLDGEPVEMAELPERLRKIGATPDTPIVFKTQGDVPPRMLRSLVGALQSHGYTKAAFQGPRHADAYVK